MNIIEGSRTRLSGSQARVAAWRMMVGHDTMQGATLYQSACASCHGVDGKGSTDREHSSLLHIASISGLKSAALMQVIAHGVDRPVGDTHAPMPAFRDRLDHGQIASLANYVRTTFGGVEGSVNASQIATIPDDQVDTPWRIQNAKWRAIPATMVTLLIVWTGVRMCGERG